MPAGFPLRLQYSFAPHPRGGAVLRIECEQPFAAEIWWMTDVKFMRFCG